MKKFVFDIIVILIITFVSGEIISRLFELQSENIKFIVKDNEGFYSNKPNSLGEFIFGKYPTIYKNKFRLNDIGFNSKLDFKQLNDSLVNVAFLGDSFVESYHVDYNNSLSSILMEKHKNFQSFDFGVSGYAINDFIDIYKKYNLESFKYVFLIINLDDITNGRTRSKYNLNKERFRELYNSSHFFSYLNFNHKIFSSIQSIFKSKSIISNSEHILDLNQKDFLNKKNIIVMPRDKETYKFLIKNKINNLVKIKHNLTPYDYGFDSHWNLNGTNNVINSLDSILISDH
jgi:hypothetical protein